MEMNWEMEKNWEWKCIGNGNELRMEINLE